MQGAPWGELLAPPSDAFSKEVGANCVPPPGDAGPWRERQLLRRHGDERFRHAVDVCCSGSEQRHRR